MTIALQKAILEDTEGWAGLELAELDAMDPAEKQQRLLVYGHYLSVFMQTEQGKFVLNDLVRTFIVTPQTVEAGDTEFAAGIKQGHANVVRRILKFISAAQTGGAPT